MAVGQVSQRDERLLTGEHPVLLDSVASREDVRVARALLVVDPEPARNANLQSGISSERVVWGDAGGGEYHSGFEHFAVGERYLGGRNQGSFCVQNNSNAVCNQTFV